MARALFRRGRRAEGVLAGAGGQAQPGARTSPATSTTAGVVAFFDQHLGGSPRVRRSTATSASRSSAADSEPVRTCDTRSFPMHRRRIPASSMTRGKVGRPAAPPASSPRSRPRLPATRKRSQDALLAPHPRAPAPTPPSAATTDFAPIRTVADYRRHVAGRRLRVRRAVHRARPEGRDRRPARRPAGAHVRPDQRHHRGPQAHPGHAASTSPTTAAAGTCGACGRSATTASRSFLRPIVQMSATRTSSAPRPASPAATCPG